jgi:hypothetical protein
MQRCVHRIFAHRSLPYPLHSFVSCASCQRPNSAALTFAHRHFSQGNNTAMKLTMLAAVVVAVSGQDVIIKNDGADNLLVQPAQGKDVQTNLGTAGSFVVK